jgi:hypothetical protein
MGCFLPTQNIPIEITFAECIQACMCINQPLKDILTNSIQVL